MCFVPRCMQRSQMNWIARNAVLYLKNANTLSSRTSSCVPPPPPPAADHPNLPSLLVSSKKTFTLFYEMENINSSNSASWGGFYEQELLYFVVFFESAD